MYEILKNVYICIAISTILKGRVRIIEKSGENRLEETLATCLQSKVLKPDPERGIITLKLNEMKSLESLQQCFSLISKNQASKIFFQFVISAMRMRQSWRMQ